MRVHLFILGALSATVILGQPARLWDPAKAAAYMDARTEWWIAWPKAARDHGTFCISCHTAAPLALARPALEDFAGLKADAKAQRSILIENSRKRVRLGAQAEPFYPGPAKTPESAGTEAILNALILVSNDARGGTLSVESRLALDHLWATQAKSGEWAWLQFHNAPWEGDSQFYGNALAALTIGSAPEGYQSEPAIQERVGQLRVWLTSHSAEQKALDRAVLLWASTKLKGLLDSSRQQRIVEELLARQRDDGGFSTASLIAPWKRKDNTPLDEASDGYATGLIAYTLEQLNSPATRPQLGRALAWLEKNQLPDGRWHASSLNRERELSSDAGLFMSDAATAYAILALTGARAR